MLYKQNPLKAPKTSWAHVTIGMSAEELSALSEFSQAIGATRHAMLRTALFRGVESLKAELAIPESDQSLS